MSRWMPPSWPSCQRCPIGSNHEPPPSDLAIFQYTSGTTREMPDAIRHTHRAVVVVMNAALYGTGLRPGDRFFCPSSPAWGHGLWHGTLAPLALGIETGAYAGKFNAERLLKALQDYGSTNLSAAATHYRMMKRHRPDRGLPDGAAKTFVHRRTDRPGDPLFIQDAFGTRLCSMYGTTEVGVVLANYPAPPTSRPSRIRSAGRFRASRSKCSDRTDPAANPMN